MKSISPGLPKLPARPITLRQAKPLERVQKFCGDSTADFNPGPFYYDGCGGL